jgi:hypothetical protein
MFVAPELPKELVALSQREFNLVCRLVEEQHANNLFCVPLLLRGVFTRLPTPPEWEIIKRRLKLARDKVTATRMHEQRRVYMREYMRRRREAAASASVR